VSEDPFRVAVVVPVRDGAPWLAEAIESVLAQEHAASETIVVDDGSTDASATVARSFGARVRVVAQPPLGAGAARNRGVAETTSPWLAFLDADDRWRPEKLRAQRDAIARTRGAVASTGRIRQFFDPSLGRAGVPEPEVLEGTSPIAVVLRRDTFLATGGFSTDPAVAESADWWFRFASSRPVVAAVDAVVAERRLHARNAGVARPDLRRDYLRLAKAALDRRRAAGNGP